MPSDRGRILLVEDDPVMGGSLAQRLRLKGYGVDWAHGAAEAAAALARRLPDLLLSDLRLPDGSGEELFLAHRERLAGTPVLMMTAYAGIDQAIRLLKAGADDFLVKPLETADLLGRVEALLARRLVAPEDAVLGPSVPIRRVEAMLRRAATSDSPLLLLGETGTGKEVAARLLHALSPRARLPFIAVNCAAIPADLLESEVFGHERGAFTGAAARREGYAERAAGGTLFLDEVAELPPPLQAKLLRLLEAREFSRVGGTATLPYRARTVAATNADLDARVHDGRFRADLLYRLDVIRVEIPPMRVRPEDVVHLARHFLDNAAGRATRTVRGFDAQAVSAMEAHAWPGNARELRNRVDRAVALADGPWIGVADLFPDHRPDPTGTADATLAEVLVAAERRAVANALEATGWDVGAAASRLGVGRSTLFEKVRRLGLARPIEPGTSPASGTA
ncbi:sigma-54-dependent Fis family transcriptional regulator [Roseomonas frigidaquae]|uniref:Sigma-54-dependent Fis family transcriptional regulator n=1 Tax=Falsiroseomonas frigidaquae TaxID=487318 RepID=A0ABX1ES66_9PROT|nr:sigma-54 dependent transcriptional regulator [Falsiroseomonas frigidaquae]NKE43446.1 sigma-54-dependent Fis family transcriptional regulator [Falsiroseomonas frigidaquae]